MTTNPTPTPEPTSPTAVVVGKRNSQTMVPGEPRVEAAFVAQHPGDLTAVHSRRHDARPTKVANCARCDRIEAREEIDQPKARIAELEAAKPQYGAGDLPYGLTVAEDGSYLDWRGEHYTRTSDIAVKPEPGPWLRGDELAAVMPTLKAGDVVEVEHEGHRASGELWEHVHDGLFLWGSGVRWDAGNPGLYVDALRIIERAPERAPEPEPEPGADIPDEVVAAAMGVLYDEGDGELPTNEVLRAALAAADAKRAELEEQA